MERRVEAEVTVSEQLYRSMVYFQMFRRKKASRPLMITAYLISLGVVAARFAGYYDVGAYSFGVFTFCFVRCCSGCSPNIRCGGSPVRAGR